MTRLRAVASVAVLMGSVTFLIGRSPLRAQQAPQPTPPPKPPTITDPEGHVVNSEAQKFKVEVVAKDL